MGSLADPAVVCDILDALTVNLDVHLVAGLAQGAVRLAERGGPGEPAHAPPCDLRHSCVTRRLNSGVPATGHRGSRVGRAPGGDPHARLGPVRDRAGRRMDDALRLDRGRQDEGEEK